MLFKNKKKTIDASVFDAEIKEYFFEVQIAEEERRRAERNKRGESEGSKVKYQVRDVNYDNLDEAYHNWEKENAVMDSFSANVLRLMNEKGMTPSKLYKKSGLDRKLFSRLKNDYMYQPNRNTAIKLCLGLDLGIDEAEELLKKAGFSLSNNQSFDLIIRFCIEKGYTDIDIVNAILKRFEENEI